MELHAIGLLSALGAVVFASISAANVRAAVLALAATGLGLAAFGTPPSAATAGALGVAAAALHFCKPRWHAVAPFAAGALGSVWIATLERQGLSRAAAVLLAVALLGIAAALTARRPRFAPAGLRDEAAVVVGIFGAAVLVGGELVAGWRTATALASQPLRAAEAPVGIGLAAIVLGALALGGIYTLWTRR